MAPRGARAADEGSAGSAVLSEARLAATGDLLNVAEALLVWVATQSLRHRWSGGQLPADLAPQNAPQAGTLIRSVFENLLLTWVELSGLEPLTSCMPSGGSTSTRVHPRRSPSSPVPARPPLSMYVAVLPCCTAPLSGGGTSRARDKGLTSGNVVVVPRAWRRPRPACRSDRRAHPPRCSAPPPYPRSGRGPGP
jgi:hypothetical protein